MQHHLRRFLSRRCQAINAVKDVAGGKREAASATHSPTIELSLHADVGSDDNSNADYPDERDLPSPIPVPAAKRPKALYPVDRAAASPKVCQGMIWWSRHVCMVYLSCLCRQVYTDAFPACWSVSHCPPLVIRGKKGYQGTTLPSPPRVHPPPVSIPPPRGGTVTWPMNNKKSIGNHRRRRR